MTCKGVFLDNFILYTIGISLSIFVIYFIGIMKAPYNPQIVKNEHFECGLPASSATPKRANFGFFIFAILFIIVDMSGLFFTLIVFADNLHAQLIASIFALILAVSMSIAMKEYKNVKDI